MAVDGIALMRKFVSAKNFPDRSLKNDNDTMPVSNGKSNERMTQIRVSKTFESQTMKTSQSGVKNASLLTVIG